MNTAHELWERYRKHLCIAPTTAVWLDVSRMRFTDEFLMKMESPIGLALEAMAELERGAIANPDERRMVGHYWLRAPELAPTAEVRTAIEGTLAGVERFAGRVAAGEVRPQRQPRFRGQLVVGIGGSALGPQFVADALGAPSDPVRTFFFDNTDPDGIDRVLARIGDRLDETLTVVISKSGGTKETRNGMVEAEAAYEAIGLEFARHAVAVTGEGSQLDRLARDRGFLARFPMWDWVGGRTSETSAVGLLPAALQGFAIREILAGAAAMDADTRARDFRRNPAALLALMWHHVGSGRGLKDMVVLPYSDRLSLFSRYLQQLVMESLGKEKDLSGRTVNQGIAVYGNKGSTDQHAYVQQLREGIDNFFVTFLEVVKERSRPSIDVEPGVTSGDFLSGFLQGTRRALYENGRESITITVPDAGARSVGALIALFERAVGLYAHLINVNAYNQPGVEAGKKAAEGVLELQRLLMSELRAGGASWRTAAELASAIGRGDDSETAFKILHRLGANPGRGVKARLEGSPTDAVFASEGH